jgi:serpin B
MKRTGKYDSFEPMRWFLAIGMAAVGAACTQGVDPEGNAPTDYRELRSMVPHDTAPAISPDDYAKVIAGSTEFGLSLFRKAVPATDNFFYSPVSTTLALAMTYAGARGNTATEMASVLGSTVAPDVFAAAMNRLMLDLVSRNVAPHEASDRTTKSVTLLPANAVWMQSGVDFSPEYLDTMSARYDAGVKVLDFQADPMGSTKVINRWVTSQTREKVVDLIPDGVIDPQTRFVLTNALYFYASWKTAFIAASTKDETFHALPEADVTVPTMHDDRSALYGEGDGYRIADIPYDGDRLAMSFVLPDVGRFAEIRDGLTREKFEGMRSGMNIVPSVKLALPKFRFAWGTESIVSELIALGMVDAFSPGRADFSGILPSGEVYISDVLHKAFIGVDEIGTEAAAATAVVGRDTSAPTMRREFIVDRPFLVFIVDASGAVLFAGQVTNPAR